MRRAANGNSNSNSGRHGNGEKELLNHKRLEQEPLDETTSSSLIVVIFFLSISSAGLHKMRLLRRHSALQ